MNIFVVNFTWNAPMCVRHAWCACGSVGGWDRGSWNCKQAIVLDLHAVAQW